eukprot:357665-Chlamydomonas_euryale.AAC.4
MGLMALMLAAAVATVSADGHMMEDMYPDKYYVSLLPVVDRLPATSCRHALAYGDSIWCSTRNCQHDSCRCSHACTFYLASLLCKLACHRGQVESRAARKVVHPAFEARLTCVCTADVHSARTAIPCCRFLRLSFSPCFLSAGSLRRPT